MRAAEKVTGGRKRPRNNAMTVTAAAASAAAADNDAEQAAAPRKKQRTSYVRLGTKSLQVKTDRGDRRASLSTPRRQRPPRDVVEKINRDAQMALLADRALNRPFGLRGDAVKEVASQFGVSAATVRRKSETVAAGGLIPLRDGRQNRERPVFGKLKGIVDKLMVRLKGEVSLRDLQTLIGGDPVVSLSAIHEAVADLGWVKRIPRQLPTLTDRHFALRLEWARARAALYAKIKSFEILEFHIDEKMFVHHDAESRYMKLSTGENAEALNVASKTQPTRLMYTCCVARPVVKDDKVLFDGKLAMWPLTHDVVALKGSKYFKKGETRQDALDDNIDRDYFVEQFFNFTGVHDVRGGGLVQLARKQASELRLQGVDTKSIRFQMDSAGGHGGGRATTVETAGMNETIRQLQRSLEILDGRDDIREAHVKFVKRLFELKKLSEAKIKEELARANLTAERGTKNALARTLAEHEYPPFQGPIPRNAGVPVPFPVAFVAQSPCSPDQNACDLGIFFSVDTHSKDQQLAHKLAKSNVSVMTRAELVALFGES